MTSPVANRIPAAATGPMFQAAPPSLLEPLPMPGQQTQPAIMPGGLTPSPAAHPQAADTFADDAETTLRSSDRRVCTSATDHERADDALATATGNPSLARLGVNKRRYLAVCAVARSRVAVCGPGDEPRCSEPEVRGARPGLLPLVSGRLLPKAGADGSADAVPMVLFDVLPQAPAADSADTMPVVSELLLPQAAGSGAAQLRAVVSLRADGAELSLSSGRVFFDFRVPYSSPYGAAIKGGSLAARF